ncbi:hypothetical protein [Parasitella parasitica]|uniref:Uncharacterized protein n=1 Tax=Parasitella parasitica TaxID=35722 RepID=A0A0B7MVU7_9FUNG|nr:hypothetical protein [Parasitella parasitica]
MFYFLRFFRAGTTHRVEGSLNVSAYSFDDSNKAFASVRVGISAISPIREIDHQNNLIGEGFSAGCVAVNGSSFPMNKEYKKCRFIIMKYVWDNWSNDKLVDGKKDALKEAFSDNLEDLYEDLVDSQKVPMNMNPIAIQEVAVKRLRKNKNSSRTERTVAVRVPNPHILPLDILSDLLILSEVANDDVALDPALFVVPLSATSSNRTTNMES